MRTEASGGLANVEVLKLAFQVFERALIGLEFMSIRTLVRVTDLRTDFMQTTVDQCHQDFPLAIIEFEIHDGPPPNLRGMIARPTISNSRA